MSVVASTAVTSTTEYRLPWCRRMRHRERSCDGRGVASRTELLRIPQGERISKKVSTPSGQDGDRHASSGTIKPIAGCWLVQRDVNWVSRRRR